MTGQADSKKTTNLPFLFFLKETSTTPLSLGNKGKVDRTWCVGALLPYPQPSEHLPFPWPVFTTIWCHKPRVDATHFVLETLSPSQEQLPCPLVPAVTQNSIATALASGCLQPDQKEEWEQGHNSPPKSMQDFHPVSSKQRPACLSK